MLLKVIHRLSAHGPRSGYSCFNCPQSPTAVSFDLSLSYLLAIAFAFEIQNGRMVYQPINGGDSHDFVREYAVPFTERLVRSDEQGERRKFNQAKEIFKDVKRWAVNDVL